MPMSRFARLSLALALAGSAAPVAAQPSTVVLVRHAEKAAAGGADPALSEAGEARAAALAVALRDAGVNAAVVTQFRRTAGTAAPLLAARSITPVVVPATGDLAAHVQAVVKAVRAQPAGSTVLVVGHSNTIPAIVAALGGPTMRDLCESEYSDLFIVTGASGGAPGLVHARYGPADPPAAPGCPAMGTR